MAYKTASEYPHGVNGVNFAIDQGAFVKDDRFKNGGEFTTPAHAGDIVALDATVAWGVKVCGAGDAAIGRAVGEPFGPIEGQAIAVDLFGDRIYDLKIDTTSAAIGIGDFLKPAGAKMTLCAAGEVSSFKALEAVADPAADVAIPVLCGFYGGVAAVPAP